jgi:hypothetical protein
MSGLLHACWLPAGCLWPLLLLLLSACRGRTEVRVAFRSCCWLLLFHCAWRVAAGCLCLSACLRKLFICNFMQSGHLNLLRLAFMLASRPPGHPGPHKTRTIRQGSRDPSLALGSVRPYDRVCPHVWPWAYNVPDVAGGARWWGRSGLVAS